jgi:hypothetical protein
MGKTTVLSPTRFRVLLIILESLLLNNTFILFYLLIVE